MTTRERLIDAARQCLLERGHQASSVKAIAEVAGVNHGLVHHYFGAKEQLWVAVVEREAERLRGSLEATQEGFMDRFYVPELLRHPDRMRLAIEFLGLARSAPAVADALREHFRLNRQAIGRRFGITDDATTTLVFAALFGMVIHAGLDPELAVESAAQRLLNLLHAGPIERGKMPAQRSRRNH